jgi:8-oxo-dGTP pyrophosphatase MutT (NUDIX family)
MELSQNSLKFFLLLLLCKSFSLITSPAGVFPYSQFNGKYVILLGVDHHRPGYWMDFGGKSDWNETPIETAAREFSEETMFCFYSSLAEVQKKLKAVTPLVVSNGYHMYFLDVPFVPDLNAVQHALRAKHHIKGQAGSGYSWLLAHHIEKIDYTWVYADDLKEAFAKAKGNHKKIIVESIDGRTITLHSLLAKSLYSAQAQNILDSLKSKVQLF